MGSFDPGWYADPLGTGNQRYWDGVQWSSHTASLDGTQSNDDLAVLSPEEIATSAAAANPTEMTSPMAEMVSPSATPPATLLDPSSLAAPPADIPPVRPNAPFAPTRASAPPTGPDNPASPFAPAGPFTPAGPAFSGDAPGVRPSNGLFLAEAPPEGASAHPATGWILALIIAGLQALNQFLPLFSIDGTNVLPNLDQSGDTSWTLVIAGLTSAAVFAVSGILGRQGRSTWISLATGFALMLGAQISIEFAQMVEPLTSEFLNTTPGVGFVSFGLTAVLAGVLVIIALPGALSRQKGSLNPLIAGVITLAMAFLVYSMSKAYHDTVGVFWIGEAKLLSLTFLVPTVMLAIISLLVIVIRNADIAALAAGATLPFGLEYLLRQFTNPPNLGNASFLFAEGKVGIPALVAVVIGIFVIGAWGRRLYQTADDSPILDLRSPQRLLAIAGPAVVILATFIGLATNGIGNPFAGSADSLSETSSVSANDSRSHQIRAATTGDYEISVNGNSGFDAVMDVYVDDSFITTIDDVGGSSDPYHIVFASSGQTIRVEVSGFQGAPGGYSINISRF